MEKNKKTFQYLKIKKIINSQELIILAALTKQGRMGTWIAINEKIKASRFEGFKVTNAALKRVLIGSVFKTQTCLVSGPIVLLVADKKLKGRSPLKQAQAAMGPEISFLALKIGERIVPCHKTLTLSHTFSYKKSSLKSLKGSNDSFKRVLKALFLKQWQV